MFSSFLCARFARRLSPGLLALALLAPGAARAKGPCLRAVAVRGVAILGTGAMEGWRRWLNAALVMAGKETGPSLPDGHCTALPLTGAVQGGAGGWSFSGALALRPPRRLSARGRSLRDWYGASLPWFGLSPAQAPLPGAEEMAAWTFLGQHGAVRPLEARQSLAQLAAPTDAARLELALLLLAQNPDFARARALLEELGRRHPQSSGPALALGQLCSLLSDNRCVRAVLEPLLARPPAPLEAWAYLFAAAQEAGDWPAMSRFAAGAARADPRNAYYHYQWAVALVNTGKLKEAVAPLKKAVTLDRSYREQARSDPQLRALRASPFWKSLGVN